MKIGLDISQIIYKNTGVSRFTDGLLLTILTHDDSSKNQWSFLFSSLRRNLDEGIQKQIISTKHILCSYPLPPMLLSFLWNKLHVFPVEYLLGNLDWYLSSDWTQPPSKSKKATIVHDLVFRKFPETVAPSVLQVQKKRLEWVTKEVDLILVDSQTTKYDLLRYYPIQEKRVHVLYPGVSPLPDSPDPQAVLRKYNLNKPFLLTVGKQEPRKNIKRLIEAFENSSAESKTDLVIVGEPGWGEKIVVGNNHTHFLQKVTDIELSALYKNCLAFIYPSLYEGFGYPVVEAMQLGAAVAVSDNSSLKEIVGDTGFLFDPQNTKEITKTIEHIVADPAYCKVLTIKGKRRAQTFSWESYYQSLMELLTKT